MNTEETRKTGNDRLAAEAIQLKKETGYPFSKFASDHGIPENRLHGMLNRYRMKFGITERFGSTREVNGKHLVRISCEKKHSSEIVIEYFGACIKAEEASLTMLLKAIRDVR